MNTKDSDFTFKFDLYGEMGGNKDKFFQWNIHSLEFQKNKVICSPLLVLKSELSMQIVSYFDMITSDKQIYERKGI